MRFKEFLENHHGGHVEEIRQEFVDLMKDIKHVQTLEGVVKLKQRLNRWGNTFNSYFDHISRSAPFVQALKNFYRKPNDPDTSQANVSITADEIRGKVRDLRLALNLPDEDWTNKEKREVWINSVRIKAEDVWRTLEEVSERFPNNKLSIGINYDKDI